MDFPPFLDSLHMYQTRSRKLYLLKGPSFSQKVITLLLSHFTTTHIRDIKYYGIGVGVERNN